ncbi:MAG: hypothetical protein J0I84_11575 [Terrimonas sp.]|nr:hypothetical protein [Terrimonas sp.]
MKAYIQQRAFVSSFVQTIKTNAPAIIAALFILLFVYTGINKLLNLDSLTLVLKKYPLIGNKRASPVAWSVPIAELMVALFLFMPKTRLSGLQSAVVLMILFTLYLSYMLAFTDVRVCTCGGMLEALRWQQHLIFNISFVVQWLWAIHLTKQKR